MNAEANVSISVSEAIATLTLARPEVLNAIDDALLTDLDAALDTLERREDVDALILTGSGERAFAAGADIGELRAYTMHTGLAARMQRVFDRIEGFDKPTIAAVNGYALGGGCELAMACDIRIAADTAQFGLPETALGVLPGAGGTQRLARLVGTGRAMELILTGRRVDSSEALRIGLVTDVTAPADLLTAARTCASQITARGPLAVHLAKLVVRAGMDTDRRTGLLLETLAQTVLYATDDKRAGAEAFLAKRAPAFTGH